MGYLDQIKKRFMGVSKPSVDDVILSYYNKGTTEVTKPPRVSKPPYTLAQYMTSISEARYWQDIWIGPDYCQSVHDDKEYVVNFPNEAVLLYELLNAYKKDMFSVNPVDDVKLNFIMLKYASKDIHISGNKVSKNNDSAYLHLCVSEKGHKIEFMLYPVEHYRNGYYCKYTDESKDLYNKFISWIEDSKEKSIEELTDGHFGYM